MEHRTRRATSPSRGPQGDYWGAWKTRLSAKGLSQDDQRRYLAVGVTSAAPTPETSRAFFEWLAEQDAAVIEKHISCVLRHILHRSGPGNWAETFTDIPFIPARERDNVRLVSLRTARRRPVYLPDVRDIAEAIIKQDSGILLIIDRLREVSEPISGPLRAMGIRSLREAAGEPEHVAGSGTIIEAPVAFSNQFEALRSPRFRRTFLKRLDELGVEAALIWRDWQDRLAKVTTVRCADEVTARYRLYGQTYTLPAEAGFDLGSGTFWIKRGQVRGVSGIYEAIAAQLVFRPAARPVHFLALERALALEVHDPSFGRPRANATAVQDEAVAEDEAEQTDGVQSPQDDSEPGEAIFGHSPFEPDPTRNIPKPRPIPPESAPLPPRPQSRTRGSGAKDGNRDSAPTPELEREHVEALKKDHYASHCQMCLCERSPQELAPAGSYVQWEEVRRRVVEAHHPDLKSGGGARHAGNLVLLCKLHHDNYGRRLTRAALSDALRGPIKEIVVRFADREGSCFDVQGRKIEVAIRDTGEVVSLFFTEQHAEYWLSER